MSGVVSKKLKFKGDKPKKKKRTREVADDADEIAAMAAGDPRGVFPVILPIRHIRRIASPAMAVLLKITSEIGPVS